jgi:hypothetical protein
MLVWGIVLKTDFLRFFDQVGRRIPPPQAYDFRAHCDKLLLVNTDWHNCSQARKVVEKGERYRKESFDDREWRPTGSVIDARTILVIIDTNLFDLVVTLIPYESAKAVCGMVAMWCGLCTTKCLKYW